MEEEVEEKDHFRLVMNVGYADNGYILNMAKESKDGRVFDLQVKVMSSKKRVKNFVESFIHNELIELQTKKGKDGEERKEEQE